MKTLLVCVLLLSGCAKAEDPKNEVPIAGGTSYVAPVLDNALVRFENDEVVCYLTSLGGISCKWKEEKKK